MKEAARCLGLNLNLEGTCSVTDTTSKVPQKFYLPHKRKETNFVNVVCQSLSTINPPKEDVKEQKDEWQGKNYNSGVTVKEEKDVNQFRQSSQVKVYLKEKVNCPVCKQIYRSKPILKKHMNRKHKGYVYDMEKAIEKFPCKFCPKRLRTKRSLYYHIKKQHRGVKEDKTPICSFCQKTFGSKKILRIHKKQSSSRYDNRR